MWAYLGIIRVDPPHRIPISLSIVYHESCEVYLWHSILCLDNTQSFLMFQSICVAPSIDCILQHTNVNTSQYQLPYSWDTVNVQSYLCLTWSNLIQEFSMSPPPLRQAFSLTSPYYCLEGLHTSWKQTLCPLNTFGNLLLCMNLKAEWSLSVIILSIVPIPLCT